MIAWYLDSNDWSLLLNLSSLWFAMDTIIIHTRTHLEKFCKYIIIMPYKIEKIKIVYSSSCHQFLLLVFCQTWINRMEEEKLVTEGPYVNANNIISQTPYFWSLNKLYQASTVQCKWPSPVFQLNSTNSVSCFKTKY